MDRLDKAVGEVQPGQETEPDLPKTVKVLRADFITHNVKRFVVEKPSGLAYLPGQAVDISINKPGLQDELRPFTFTSVPASNYLEFIVKIYSDHDGVTKKLATINPGDELILHDIFGAITYRGPGLFIAGGAGITPFISIFRQLKRENRLAGNTLLFANRTDADIILKEELSALLGKRFINVVEGLAGNRINRELLQRYIRPEFEYYYICGPDKFTQAMVENLLQSGVNQSQIVIEQ